MKKNFIRAIAVVLMLAATCFVLTSCANTLSGEYYSGDKTTTMSYTSYVFSGNKVVYSEYVAGYQFNTYEAKYTIENGNITLTWNDSKGETKTKTQSFTKQDDGSIKNPVVTYKKAEK